MGFLDQAREGREAAKSKREYAQCSKARQEKLRSFRENMILEILFKYPDANLLMTSVSRDFQVSLRSRGGLFFGEFADKYYPCLDYVGDTESTSKRREALLWYRMGISTCEGNFSSTYADLGRSCGDGRQSKGFALMGSKKLASLLGGALFLNGEQIAKASVLYPKPNGYLGAKLFDEVLQGGNRKAGIQSLMFVTAFFEYPDKQSKMNHEILFDYSLQYFDENNRKEFTGAILNLRDFISDIEDYFRPDCLMAERQRAGNWLRDSIDTEDFLDSPDRTPVRRVYYTSRSDYRYPLGTLEIEQALTGFRDPLKRERE